MGECVRNKKRVASNLFDLVIGQVICITFIAYTGHQIYSDLLGEYHTSLCASSQPTSKSGSRGFGSTISS